MSQPLLQQELLQPPPRRQLVVPAGHAAWWGVDCSVHRVAVAYTAPEGPGGARTAPFLDLRGGARMAAIFRETRRFVRELLEEWPTPGLVYVEQPSGARPNPPLQYATGVIEAAVYDAVAGVTGAPITVEETTSAHWKKVACGRGNIYKPTRKMLGRAPEFEDYDVAVWARANGYGGSSWDEADALGVAVCASRDVGLVQR